MRTRFLPKKINQTIHIIGLIFSLWIASKCSLISQSISQSEIKLEWDVNTPSNLLYNAIEHPIYKGVELYVDQLPIAGANVSVSFENVIYDTIYAPSADLLKAVTDDSFDFRYEALEISENLTLQVFILPFRKSPDGMIERLITGTIIVTTDGNTFNRPPSTTKSVLSTGEWHKIGVNLSGIHAMDGNFLESQLKWDLAKINPNNIKIYGTRGGRVPEAISIERVDDLRELSIVIVGGEDGKFDKGDKVVFYGEGPEILDVELNKYDIEKNIYDNNNYYFITQEGAGGNRVGQNGDVGSPTLILDTYEAVERVEEDLTNLLGSYPSTEGAGQEWFGEYLKTNRKIDLTNKFGLSQAVVGMPLEVKAQFAARSKSSTSVTLDVNGVKTTRVISGVSITDTEAIYANKAFFDEKYLSYSGNKNLIIDFPKGVDESEGWLDFVQVTYHKPLSLNGPSFNFRSREGINEGLIGYKLSGNITHKVWDVTNPFNVVEVKPIGNILAFKPEKSVREFVAWSMDNVKSPSYVGKIANQDIHGILDADMLIVSYDAVKSEAERLAKHRKQHSNLTTYVVDIQQVFNEFSGGKVDPTAIRDMAKMMYDRYENFKYLLLFGDGSYDFKGLVNDTLKQNFIPVYETKESLAPINAFPSDDYYGLLGDNEGVSLQGGLDIYVGRLPAKNGADAKIFVDKILHYETSPRCFGDWRMRIGYSADDEDGDTHIRDMESIANLDESRHPAYNQQKVYFDAYTQTSTSGENRFPDANRIINENVLKGQLALTYLGHGGPLGWSQERVLTIPDIVSWDNYDAMSIMTTATCSFAAYDDPSILTPAENAILNPKGGVIALFSTTRAVFTNSNKDLTNSVNEILFKKVNLKAPTLGYALTTGKNKFTGDFFRINSRKFTLLGDPAMQVAMPKFNVVTTKVNGNDVNIPDTTSALEKITIEGIITDNNGNIVTDFNGTLTPTVFDKVAKLQTLGNDSGSSKFPFTAYRNVIFKGNASVDNGKWSFSFWVPKTINYNIGNARVSYYATDNEKYDAGGYYNTLIIGGPSKNIVSDDEGPKIQIFMDDESFVEGDETESNPLLILKLEDDLGINVTGNAIGQDITAKIDNDNKFTYILNDAYIGDKNNPSKGTVRFRLKDLSLGRHTLKAKAWDIAGNSTENETTFVVVERLDDLIENLLAWPNPFDVSTTLEFGLSVDQSVNIQVPIFDSKGSLVHTIKAQASASSEKVRIDIDSKTVKDVFLSNGIYFYKVFVYTRDGKIMRESKGGKLIKMGTQ